MKNIFLKSFFIFIITCLVLTSPAKVKKISASASEYGDDGVPRISPPYTVVVEYSSLDKYLKNIRSRWVSRDAIKELIRNNGKDFGKKDLYLFTFHNAKNSKQIIQEMNIRGFRPATIFELAALADQGKDVFPGNPIIAFGTCCIDEGKKYVPQIWTYGQSKRMTLVPVFDGWLRYSRFVAVRH